MLWLVLLASVAAVLIAAPGLRRTRPNAWWCFIGYPLTVVRIWASWRRLTGTTGLAVPGARRGPCSGL